MAPALREVVRAGWDPGDPWGSCMGAWFGLCAALYVYGLEVPGGWEYRPGLEVRRAAWDFGSNGLKGPDVRGLEWDGLEVLELLAAGEVSGLEVVRAGAVLERYSELCRRAGRDY